MFVPLHDDNTLKHIEHQYVTLLLIAMNVACYALQVAGLTDAAVASFAIVPAEFLRFGMTGGHAPVVTQSVPAPEIVTLISYMFFHGDLLHLAGNMLFLWVFGDNVEDACGHAKFALLYCASGMIAALTHVALQPGSEVPLIGASGAVSGIIAAYLMLHPRVRVWVLAFKFVPLRISAALALGVWIALQIVMVLLPQTTPVAWWAHIGGLVAGAVLIVVLKRRGVVLFDQNLQTT